MKSPQIINDLVAGLERKLITEAHQSGDIVYQFEDKYILKISDNYERLRRERTVNDFLKDKLPVSKTVTCVEENGKAFYLKTCVKGEPLIGEYLKNPIQLAKLLAEGIRLFHSVDIKDCTIYNLDSKGNCFIHGDFCLPNILAQGEQITGFIDTEAAGIGDPWLDYAWCIWSFEYNLGTKKYTHLLLKELGIEFDNEKYEWYTNLTFDK